VQAVEQVPALRMRESFENLVYFLRSLAHFPGNYMQVNTCLSTL
jgi:hypothetical protein